MQLIKLTADKNTFHPVIFKDGINIIVGKKSNPLAKSDGNTFNGVGKSLIVHLIHFCLCSNRIDALEKCLPDWTFSLEYSDNKTIHSISRNTSNQNVITIDGVEYSKLADARDKLKKSALSDDSISNILTFQQLLSKFVRRYRSSYVKYDDSNSSHPDVYSNLLINGALLGLNTELITKKRNYEKNRNHFVK